MLVPQRGFYLYSNLANRQKTAEKELTPSRHWSDVLNGGKIAVSKADLEQAKKIREFKSQNLENYHNLYLN